MESMISKTQFVLIVLVAVVFGLFGGMSGLISGGRTGMVTGFIGSFLFGGLVAYGAAAVWNSKRGNDEPLTMEDLE